MAGSGQPNIALVLTVNPLCADTVQERYRALHDAWKKLVKRILREFKKPSNERWYLKTEDGYYYQDPQSYAYTKQTRPGSISRLHYMAFPEETELKEPHLHVLLRTKYIPQRWISQQMKDLIGSPIVWIEKIRGTKSAVAYMTKYVTTAPAQFGKSKRYWFSRFYQLKKRERKEEPLFTRINSRLVNMTFSDLIREIVQKGLIPLPTARLELRLLTLREALDRNGNPLGGLTDAQLVGSSAWLQGWRQQCRV